MRTRDLELAFDVGHSSIGWAVLQTNPDVELKGCGVVIFRADDCLASQRRAYRRQRRHIRSTRQRIKRMKVLLLRLGVLTKEQLDKPGCAWPWKLAARVLASNGQQTLTWPELWDVLRWYAHNRGYDGNREWSRTGVDDDAEDAEKVQNAHALMDKFGTKTMAETVCAFLGIDPLAKKSSSRERFKGLNAAFERRVLLEEVRVILQAHFGKLKCADSDLEKALCRDGRAIACPEIKLPGRYHGGLLFGQLVPRFDNRIISKCPVTGQKVPSRNCPEFLNFRWGMQLANVRVAGIGDKELRSLRPEERKQIDARMREQGAMTPTEFKEAVRSASGCVRNNLETMFMHPDAKEALLLDPIQDSLNTKHWKTLFPKLPARIQKRTRGHLRRGKAVTLGGLYEGAKAIGGPVAAFDDEIRRLLDTANTKKAKKEKQLSRESILGEKLRVRRESGRAAYARPILQKAFEEVMAGKHPKEDGCLLVTEQMRQAQLNRSLAEQTNNHLVRHRLLILERLQRDIIKEYASGDRSRVARITIEVNRDLREMSGKTNYEKQAELNNRIKNHHTVAEKLAKAFEGQKFNGEPVSIGAGLIRKARIAEDLGWTCPYTGQKYEPIDLLTRRVDKDHIVPRSQRMSDALEALVITFSAVNKWKGKRTALKFVEDEQGKPVPDAPNLSIVSLARYRAFVDALEIRKGHNDDQKRKKRRKALLLVRDYEEGEFTPRDLTQTSQLVRLGAEMLKRPFVDEKQPPAIVSMPGSVTGAVRKGLNLLGCLSEACPQVLDEGGEVKTKTDIRDITHLHHALDACVLALTTHFIPNNGSVWELIVKRNLSDVEKEQLRTATRGMFNYTSEGFRVAEMSAPLKEQLRKRLAEKRVVQHIPKRISGLRVEQNTWRVREKNDAEVVLEQRIRQPDGTRPTKQAVERASKLIGLEAGKLHNLKGALVVGENFGVALDPEPGIIPFHKVWSRLQERKKANGDRMPRVLRNGQLIQVPKGRYQGIWRVFSAKATLTLDLGSPDVVRLESKGDRQRREVQLKTLLKDGMTVLSTTLTGISSAPKQS